MAPPKNVIHIKFDHSEALNAKKDILSSQLEILKILTIIKNYHKLRSKELKTKIKLQKKIKQVLLSIKKLELTFPEFKIPKILKHPSQKKSLIKKEIEKKENKPREKYDSSIESQLREIQNKLNSLQ